MRERKTKGDCKVQTLALEIITPLNECTGRLSRVSTRHKHNMRGMQKEGKRKAQPQPFPDTKRKRKQTKPNKRKSNKRTKSTKINPLFTKRGNRSAKRTKTHKNKLTQDKTENKSPRRRNDKATKSKTYRRHRLRTVSRINHGIPSHDTIQFPIGLAAEEILVQNWILKLNRNGVYKIQKTLCSVYGTDNLI